jgi:hypothetical protein
MTILGVAHLARDYEVSAGFGELFVDASKKMEKERKGN